MLSLQYVMLLYTILTQKATEARRWYVYDIIYLAAVRRFIWRPLDEQQKKGISSLKVRIFHLNIIMECIVIYNHKCIKVYMTYCCAQ